MADQDEGAGPDSECGITRMSDHSGALADKLLQGWALLQEHCPQCFTPLVRNRQRKIFCVACSQWVVPQTEAAEQLARQRVEIGGGENGADPSLLLPQPASIGFISSPLNNNENGRQLPSADPSAPISPSMRGSQEMANMQGVLPQTSITRDTPSIVLIPKLNYHYPKTLEQVIPNVSSMLAHKLEEIGNAILTSDNVNDLRMLMTLLRECSESLEALKAL